MKRESRRFSRGGFRYVEYWTRKKKWTYHRKGSKAGQKWYKGSRWRKVTRKLGPVEEKEWWKTTLSYKCTKASVPNAWHIDLTKVTEALTVFDSIVKQEKYCLEFLGRGFTKALREKEVYSTDWQKDLPKNKYSFYKETQEILDSKGIVFETAVESDGEGNEEVLELWRCSKLT